MKIAFFGTPDFAAQILEGILKYEDVNCVLVVSQPDRAVGRKQELTPTPVKKYALESELDVVQPVKIRVNPKLQRWQSARVFQDTLRPLDLDFIVVVAYGKIIPKAILDIPKYGCVNIHGSILPKYRGASPVQAALKDGQSETGLTIMYMSEGMDEGNVLSVEKVPIDNVDTSEDIFKKFAEIGPELLVSTLRKVMQGTIEGVPQVNSEATCCGKISREDGEVSFQQQTAQEIYNLYRAYTPWPGIFTWYKGKRLALTPSLSCEECELFINGKNVGEFIKIGKNRYGIICKDMKILELKHVKLEGKKSMDVVSFVNGNREVLEYLFS